MANIKHYISFSLVFLATAIILPAGQAHGSDLCSKSDHKTLCLSVVKGLTDPHKALESAINQLISKNKLAKTLNIKFSSKPQNVNECKEIFDDAIDNLEMCLENLKDHDMASLNSNLAAVLTDYVTCDDAWSDTPGVPNPFGNTDALLEKMASTCLYLATLIH